MKSILFAAAAAVVSFAAMPAAAEIYGQANLGYSVSSSADLDATIDDGSGPVSGSADVDFKNGFLVSAALGKTFGNGLRAEGELLYTKNDLDDEELFGDSQVTQIAGMANVLYDFGSGSLRPYVGAGIGYGSVAVDFDDGFLDDGGVTWQLRAGVGFNNGGPVTWDVGYRYIDMAKLDVDAEDDTMSGHIKANGQIHALTVGVRYNFGS